MSPVLEVAVLAICVAPLLLLLVLAVSALAENGLSETGIGIVTRLALVVALGGSITALVVFVTTDQGSFVISAGSWFASSNTSFAVELVVDGYSLGFAALALGICNVVAAFSFRYLHRDPGFQRYFVQLAMFVVGLTLVALAGSIEVLFVGWELLGLSSALLVGYFHERRAPATNALRVFAIYRLSDAALLGAAVLLHHHAGSGALSRVFWNDFDVNLGLSSAETLTISMLILVAVAGKSALWPFSGWLPRAMEGPTPSSAVYYGALSIHAGCFLLLRAEPLIASAPGGRAIVFGVGLCTSIFAALTARVQTDVKSLLSYSALAQVGIIVMEIALGLRALAFVHMAGHAVFRLLQFLCAPNVLHDLHELDSRLERSGQRRARRRGSLGKTAYLVAHERGFTDALLDALIVRPFQHLVSRLDRLDRWLCHFGRRDSGGGR